MKKQFILFMILCLFTFSLAGCVSKSKSKGPSKNKDLEAYDVIVVGGEPEGVAAAVSAARNGAKTLLIEKRQELGGLFTYAMLNYLDVPQGEDGHPVSKGIYEEWHKLVGKGNAFGIAQAKEAFMQLVDGEPNLTLLTETEVLDSILKDNKVTAIHIKNQDGESTIEGKTFIDATQDADFAVMSDAPYFLGGEDIGIKDKKMAVTLMIHLKNVDWTKIKETAKSEKFGPAEVTDHVAWGFTKLHFDYKAVEANTRLRGLNLAKVNDEYFINALQIFDVDGLDGQSKQDAIEKGKRETKHILKYLKAEFPGFEKAEVASYPSELYVRETRHIKAEYQLPMTDVWMNKDHWDSIGFGGYPVDIQAQTIKDYGKVLSAPKQYALPFRSLVPKKIDGLLVVGRSTGYSSLAAGSARVVPTGMVAGEAAGVAAQLSIEKAISFREMSKSEEVIHQLREDLAKQNAFVKHITTDYPYAGEWFDPAIQTLIHYGLAFGGYNNDMKVDEVATSYAFADMFKGIIERVDPATSKTHLEKVEKIHEEIFKIEKVSISRDEVAHILGEVLLDQNGPDSWKVLIEKGLVNEDIANRIPENRMLKFKEMYAIGNSVIAYLKE